MTVGIEFNEDERPRYVQFEIRAVEDKRASLEAGHYVGKDVDYVMVTSPGGKDVYENKWDIWIDRKKEEMRRGRTPKGHVEFYEKAYQAWKKNKEIPLEGTPIKGWQMLSPMQTKVILSAGIRTVEDLAQANNEALRRLGMGGRGLVTKAKSWLSTANGSGKIAMENAELKKQNENLKTTVDSLQEKVDYLIAQMEQKKDVAEVTFRNDEELGGNYVESETSEDISIEELRKMYFEKTGRKPHPRSKRKFFIDKLGL